MRVTQTHTYHFKLGIREESAMAGPPLSRFAGCAVKVALAAAMLTLAVSAQASPQSQRLIGEGRALLTKGNVDGALAKFDAAAKADPNDADALYFQGAALTRLMRHGQALTRLQAAQQKDLKKAGMDFEVGWALLGTDRFGDAIRRLQAYDRAKPGVGKTSELLGRAHMGLKQYDQAEAYLKEAIRRDGTTFATMGLGVTYELIRQDNDSLTVGYMLHSDLNGENDTHGADLLDNRWFAEYDHRFSDRWVGLRLRRRRGLRVRSPSASVRRGRGGGLHADLERLPRSQQRGGPVWVGLRPGR